MILEPLIGKRIVSQDTFMGPRKGMPFGIQTYALTSLHGRLLLVVNGMALCMMRIIYLRKKLDTFDEISGNGRVDVQGISQWAL